MSGGGFNFGGKFHPPAPNIVGEPFPIHGNGFSNAWTVESQTASAVDLFLGSCGPGRYSAHAAYGLLGGALTMRACAINRSDEPLPFGLGFHPRIVWTPDTRLKAVAETVLLESPDDLPTGAEPYLLVANGTSGRCATFLAIGSRCAPVVLFTRALTSSHARRLFLCLEEIRMRGPRLVNEGEDAPEMRPHRGERARPVVSCDSVHDRLMLREHGRQRFKTRQR
jgi:galactose mutarotase-like enzyme